MELFNWPFAISVITICITIRSIVQSRLKHQLKVEAMKTGNLEMLMEAEEYE